MKFFKFALLATLLSVAPASVSAMLSNELKHESLIEKDEEKETCSFCWEALGDDKKATTLPCKTICNKTKYHITCLKKYFLKELMDNNQPIHCAFCWEEIPYEHLEKILGTVNQSFIDEIKKNIDKLADDINKQDQYQILQSRTKVKQFWTQTLLEQKTTLIEEKLSELNLEAKNNDDVVKKKRMLLIKKIEEGILAIDKCIWQQDETIRKFLVQEEKLRQEMLKEQLKQQEEHDRKIDERLQFRRDQLFYDKLPQYICGYGVIVFSLFFIALASYAAINVGVQVYDQGFFSMIIPMVRMWLNKNFCLIDELGNQCAKLNSDTIVRILKFAKQYMNDEQFMKFFWHLFNGGRF